MGVLDWFRPRPNTVAEATVPAWKHDNLALELERVSESLGQLALMAEDRGWAELTHQGSDLITRDGLTRAAELCRVVAVANPLLKRGLGIRGSYVFGQGVEVSGRATGEDGAQDVDAVIRAFFDDEGNRDAVTGPQARLGLEHDLGTDGNVFLAHFTNPLDGRVKVRPLPFDEVAEIVTAPGDKTDPWFYLRRWVETVPTSTFGTQLSQERKAYYPALKYQPLTRPRTMGGVEVMWDAPVLHVKVNPVGNGWGIGDAYAALPWVKSYKEFLEDWAALCRALSRIAFRASSKTATGSQKARSALAGLGTAEPGSSVSLGEGQTLEAVPKTGATLDSESGRPLAAMAAAALGVTVTILLADPGTTGARAVAETLDLPMRLEMEARREVWAQAYKATGAYVIEQAVHAPRGPLKGREVRDGDRVYADLGEATDPTVEVAWPSLEDVDVKTVMDAIVAADGLAVLPKLEVLKLVLAALGVKDTDDIIDAVTDEDGEFIDPTASSGQQATDRFRDGDDPAGAF